MKRIFLLVVALLSLQIGFAQVTTINTELYKYKPGLTDKQYFDIDRINYMPKEDWEQYKADPRFDADKIVSLRDKWKKTNDRPGQLKTTASEAACYWVNPDNSYVHPNPTNWPGSPGNSTDNFSGVINLGWNFNFFGQNFNQVVITTKGTIALGNAGYIDFLPSTFPTPLGTETNQQHDHICALWSDYDFGATGELYYKVTSNALYLNYIDVGYWPVQGDKTNSFQIIICADGSGVLPDGNNVQFVYLDMQWANSQISGAAGGFNAASNIAIVGADRSTGNGHYSFGRFNLDNEIYNGPFGVNANQQDGIDWLDGRVINFNTSIANVNNNIPPVAIEDATLCDTTYLCQGEFAAFDFAYTAPESTQTVTLTATSSGTGFSSTVQTLTNSAQLVDAVFTAGPGNIGTNTVTLVGTDSGTPVGTTTITYVFVVTADIAQPLEISGPTEFCAGGETILTATPGFDSYLWSNFETDNEAEFNSAGEVTVIGFANGCESVASVELNEGSVFIPALVTDNVPIELCPGETAEVCLVEDWPTITWSIYPGFDGEFETGAPLDEVCTTVTGNVQGNYLVTVTDSTGCEGQNIQLVNVTNNFIDEANNANNGSYCDALTPVTFSGGFTNPAEDNLVIYGLSTNVGGWQGSYINVTVFPAEGGAPEVTFLTTFNTFTLFDDILIGVGDSIEIEYFANGNNFSGNSLWVINCGQNTPTIIPAPLTSGVLWSEMSTCTSQPLTGVWTVNGPGGWTFSNNGFYDGTFTPAVSGVYELCFSAPDCSSDVCYDLIYTSSPTISLSQTSDIQLCNQELVDLEAFLLDDQGTSVITWSGEGLTVDGDNLSATAGPYGNAYVNTQIAVSATNGCGTSTDSFNLQYQPNVPTPSLNDQFVCPGGLALLDPVPTAQDNPNLTYLWTPSGFQTPTINVGVGTYSVVVSNACSESNAVSVDVIDADAPTITNAPQASILECNANEVTLSVNYNNPNNYAVTWNDEPGTSTLVVTQDGNYCWEVEDISGCGLIETGCTAVDISQAPIVNGGSQELLALCPGECENLNLSAQGENLTYSWVGNCSGFTITNGGDNALFCADNVPIACLGSTIIMTGTATNGCGSDQATFLVAPDACSIKIPNVVSPNNDDKNDTFYILGLEKYEDVKLHVFDRWGKVVYETSNYGNDLSLTDLSDGVYFYTIVLPYGSQTEFEGAFHVMR